MLHLGSSGNLRTRAFHAFRSAEEEKNVDKLV